MTELSEREVPENDKSYEKERIKDEEESTQGTLKRR